MENSTTKDVFELAYMKKLLTAMNTISAYPYRVFGELHGVPKVLYYYRFVPIILSCLQVYSPICYLKKHFGVIGTSEIVRTYVNILLTVLCIQRYTLPLTKNYCVCIKKFIMEFHLMHHSHLSEFSTQIYARVNRICTTLAIILYVQCIVAVSGFNIVPFYNNYSSGLFENKPENVTFEQSVYYDLPIDQYNDIKSYIVVFIYNFYAAFNVACGMSVYDLIMFTIVLHVWGHIHILANRLETLPRMDTGKRDQSAIHYKEESEEVARILREIIVHHQFIKAFIQSTFKAFDFTFCVTLAFHLVTGCVLLLQISAMDAESLGKFGGVALVVFQQLIQMSAIFELIRSRGDKLPDQVYALPWENMDLKNRKTLLILLCNVQPSIALKAGGVIPVGVMTMSSILRTSCSYFLMLRTFTTEES